MRRLVFSLVLALALPAPAMARNVVLFIADGVIHEQGTPDQVLKHPTQPRTQAFLERHREFDF